MSSRRFVIVTAPQGSGKTTNATQLARLFDLPTSVDDWTTRQPLPAGSALLLTNESFHQCLAFADRENADCPTRRKPVTVVRMTSHLLAQLTQL